MATYGAQYQKNKKTVAKLNLEKYGSYTCEICKKSPLHRTLQEDLKGKPKEFKYSRLTIDHIVPISRGGKNGLYNLQVCCQKCNQEKGNK